MSDEMIEDRDFDDEDEPLTGGDPNMARLAAAAEAWVQVIYADPEGLALIDLAEMDGVVFVDFARFSGVGALLLSPAGIENIMPVTPSTVRICDMAEEASPDLLAGTTTLVIPDTVDEALAKLEVAKPKAKEKSKSRAKFEGEKFSSKAQAKQALGDWLVVVQGSEGLHGRRRALLLLLCRRAVDTGWKYVVAVPGFLSKETAIPRTSIQRLLRSLEDEGWLDIMSEAQLKTKAREVWRYVKRLQHEHGGELATVVMLKLVIPKTIEADDVSQERTRATKVPQVMKNVDAHGTKERA